MWRDLQDAVHDVSGHRQRLIELLRDNRTDRIFDSLVAALQGKDVDLEGGNYLVMVHHLQLFFEYNA